MGDRSKRKGVGVGVGGLELGVGGVGGVQGLGGVGGLGGVEHGVGDGVSAFASEGAVPVTPEAVQGKTRLTGGSTGRSGTKNVLSIGSQDEVKMTKTPTTPGGITPFTPGVITPLAPGAIISPTRSNNADDDEDEVLAFDNDELGNDSDNNININNSNYKDNDKSNANNHNHHHSHPAPSAYVPTLLASPPARIPPDASLKLSASMTHPLMGTSRYNNPPTHHLNTPSRISFHPRSKPSSQHRL